MSPHFSYSLHTPTFVWQRLERQAPQADADQLLEECVMRSDGAELLLGLIPRTGERTLHLHVPGSLNIMREVPHIEGLWIKSFVFPDYRLLAVVLDDKEMSTVFSEFALDLIAGLKNVDSRLVADILIEKLMEWDSLFTAGRCRRVA